MAVTVDLPIEEEPTRFGNPISARDRTPWEHLQNKNVFECRVLLCPEDEGGYSAHALRLPGVVSQGDSIEEALGNVEDAFRETLISYREDNRDIPWAAVEIDRPIGSIEKWTLVDV